MDWFEISTDATLSVCLSSVAAAMLEILTTGDFLPFATLAFPPAAGDDGEASFYLGDFDFCGDFFGDFESSVCLRMTGCTV